MTEWLDRIAYDLLAVEHEVRQALRAMTRFGGPSKAQTKGSQGGQAITLGLHEARALLRGAMPVPMALSKLRAPHAKLAAALATFSQHLLALNDPLHSPEAALAGVADLVDALEAWSAVMRWRLAGQKARVKWPAPVDITKVARLQPAEHPFPVRPLPCAYAGFAAQPYALALSPRQIARADEASLAQGDAPGGSGQVIGLRQPELPLAQPQQQARHG